MIAIVLGTKAEFIKTAPLLIELERRDVEYVLIHTGQHNINDLCEIFKIKYPDIVLFTPPKKSSRFFMKTHKALSWGLPLAYRIVKTLKKFDNIKMVLVHGDTITTGTTAVVSKVGKWRLAHLEAGLRSHDIREPFPEEFIRIVTDHLSDYLFAVSKTALRNLRSENITGKVFLTGNTIADSVKMALKFGKKADHKNHVVVNIHRNENIKSRARMKKIVDVVTSIDREVYWPIHDNTLYALKKFGLLHKIKRKENIELDKLKSYFDFLQELKSSKYIITDGGSIQEESLFLKKPCIIMRRKTERVEGLKTGINFLTKLNVGYTRKIIDMLESDFKIPKFKNPYGEPGVSKKITSILERILFKIK